MIQLKLDAPELNFELHGKGCESCSFDKFAQISKSQKTPLPLSGEVKWSEVLRIHLDALYVAQTAFRNDTNTTFYHTVLNVDDDISWDHFQLPIDFINVHVWVQIMNDLKLSGITCNNFTRKEGWHLCDVLCCTGHGPLPKPWPRLF